MESDRTSVKLNPRAGVCSKPGYQESDQLESLRQEKRKAAATRRRVIPKATSFIASQLLSAKLARRPLSSSCQVLQPYTVFGDSVLLRRNLRGRGCLVQWCAREIRDAGQEITQHHGSLQVFGGIFL
jgi:hypothetical protein